MLQHINLYPTEMKPKRSSLGAKQILLYSGLLLSILGGLIVWSYLDYLDLKKIEKRTVNDHQRLMTQFQEVRAQLENQVVDDGLQGSVEALKQKIDQDQKLLQFLESHQDKADLYSNILSLLKNHNVFGLRIHTMAIASGGRAIFLEGEVISGDAVANYIDYLESLDAFRSTRFNLLSMDKKNESAPVSEFKLTAIRQSDDHYQGFYPASADEVMSRLVRQKSL